MNATSVSMTDDIVREIGEEGGENYFRHATITDS